jgi:branched-chain amino acid aminotransferase
VLAMREARNAGAAEALIVDAHGQLLEGASSNVFLVERGRLLTPPVEAGILAGITRAHLLMLADELGIPVELSALRLEATTTADELFISSSIRELLPIVRLDGKQIGPGNPGPIYQRLLAAFRLRTRGVSTAS